MTIYINKTKYDVIVRLIKSELFTKSEMKNKKAVTTFLAELNTTEALELASWIDENPEDYCRGLFGGFNLNQR